MYTVNHPTYYNQSSMKKECIEAMVELFGEARVSSFCLLNAFKYLWRRFDKENHEQDTLKARWNLEKYNALTGKQLTMDNILCCIETFRNHNEISEATNQEHMDEIISCISKHNVLACSCCPEKDSCHIGK